MLPSLSFRISAYIFIYLYLLIKYRREVIKNNTLRSLPQLIYHLYYHNFFIANIPIITVCLIHGEYLKLIASYFYIANFDIMNRIVGITTDNKSKKDLRVEEYISLQGILIIIIMSVGASLIIQETFNEAMFYWDMFSFFYQVIYWSSPVKEIFILIGIYTQLFFVKETIVPSDWAFIIAEWLISPIQDFRDIEIDKDCRRFTFAMLPRFRDVFFVLYVFVNIIYFYYFHCIIAIIVNVFSLYIMYLLYNRKYGMAYNLHNVRYLFVFVFFFI